MSTIIDRDQAAQMAFGNALISFESEMRACCRAMRSHIEDARDTMQEANARTALNYLEELIRSIEETLPSASEFGQRQKDLAKHIQEASEYRFKR